MLLTPKQSTKRTCSYWKCNFLLGVRHPRHCIVEGIFALLGQKLQPLMAWTCASDASLKASLIVSNGKLVVPYC